MENQTWNSPQRSNPRYYAGIEHWTLRKLEEEYASVIDGNSNRPSIDLPILEREIARRRVAADKPVCKLTGEDGNVFTIIHKVSRTLNNAGQPALSKEFREKCFKAPSYAYVLNLCSEYVEVI